jgi:DNA-binding response OmpR family regulator
MPEQPKPRVLIIDDDADLVDSVTIVMDNAGWEVHSAVNGAAGLEKARELLPWLIILDILMPKKDGLSTYEDLRRDKCLAAVPIIVLTSVTEKLGFGLSERDMTLYYGRGPEAFLEKPFEPQHLLDTVKRVLPQLP